MKAPYAVLLVMLAALASQTAKAQDTSVNIPLRAGTVSVTNAGSVAVCLNPAKGYIEVSCGSKGAQAFPFTALNVGFSTGGNGSIACQTVASTFSDFPVDITPPLVSKNQNATIKILDYDPHTGVGDGSFITYNGGHCNGADFEKTGATEINHGTFHLAVSENGNRIDTITTALQDPVGGIGDFSLTGVARALVPTNP
jgi:hypothetical protein